MAESDKAFIGIRPCGCITFVLVDGYETKREKAADLKRAIKGGCTIEVTTVGEARARPNFLVQCPHGKHFRREEEINAEVERLVTSV